ncbi:MAG: ABC transporter permease [Anaerolineales bacterium]|jgi:ABC-2 type transport system permease protein
MKKILAIAWKDTRIRFQSPGELLYFFILPVVFTFLLGTVFSGTGADDRLHLPVVDLDQSSASAELIDWLAHSDSLRPEVLSADEAQTLFDDNQVIAVLTIPPGYEANLIDSHPVTLDLVKDPSNQNSLVVEQILASGAAELSRARTVAANSVAAAEALQPFQDAELRQAFYDDSLAAAQAEFAHAPQRLSLVQAVRTEENFFDTFDMASYSSAGQLITWVFIPLLGVSAYFAYERSQGTLRRLLTTPTEKSTLLLGLIFGQFVVAIVQMGILIAFGQFVMNVKWGQNIPALLLLMSAFAISSVAFGTMLATFVKTQSQAGNLSIMLGMTMALMGGCWWPLELFPQTVKTAVKILPTTWTMNGLTDLITRGASTMDILPNVGVLLLFALVFFVVGIRRLRFE